jgi:hypothetical protein
MTGSKRDKHEAEIAAAVAAANPQPVEEAAPQEPQEKTFKGLYFGTSTGELLSRSHVAASTCWVNPSMQLEGRLLQEHDHLWRHRLG